MRSSPFIVSEGIVRFVRFCDHYKECKLPSEIIDIEDEYTAYCFDEAIAYITMELLKGKTPNFRKIDQNTGEEKHYRSFSSLYEKYDSIG